MTVDRATAIAFARGVAVIAAIGAAVYWLAPWPDDPGIAACARIKAHALAGTAPGLAERVQIGKDFERSDEEALQDAGSQDRFHRDAARITLGALPSIPVDLTDFGLLYTACTDAGML
ncbi:hypothetical protein [Catenuloplanes nepalensis]|uniref:hypothetical protein n=1 Tax=Catenuloplanes nepalensis TaxID=587533 RepID=UPI0027D7AB6D|nr:hypothetical protein [Catenuloplanes nepalensis]